MAALYDSLVQLATSGTDTPTVGQSLKTIGIFGEDLGASKPR